jgi:DNA-directed RNA polymerase subunit M/transcription elongation factor TFIIS
MQKMNVESIARPVAIIAQGSVVIRCNKCGMLMADRLSPNGAVVKCVYCGSEYSYEIRLQAKPLADHTATNCTRK